MRKLRCWNGRGFNSNGDSLMVAAYSRRDAARLLTMAEYTYRKWKGSLDDYRAVGRWDRELSIYFSECWGNSMNGITPTRGVWYSRNYREVPTKIL